MSTRETEILCAAYGRCGLLAIALLAVAAFGTTGALAADKVRVVKASATTFAAFSAFLTRFAMMSFTVTAS